mmetsp:Transcript_130602/g.240215  ORF Transcript_130602/g.240215 Transcript_130602/m.240215 type:complete len:326 (-) Transcript_130602:729-1706(-)
MIEDIIPCTIAISIKIVFIPLFRSRVAPHIRIFLLFGSCICSYVLLHGGWDPWCVHLCTDELSPVEASVPRVVLEILHSETSHSEPLLRISLAQCFDHAHTLLWEVSWEGDLGKAFDDLSVSLHCISRLERGSSRHHDVDHHTQGPPVNGTIVAILAQSLWCEVISRTTNGVSLANADLCDAHVSELQIAVQCEQAIFQLQVTIYDAPVVDVLQGKRSASCVEERVCLRAEKVSIVLEDLKKLATKTWLQQEVHIPTITKSANKLHNPVTVQQLHASLLVDDCLSQMFTLYVLFGHRLQRVEPPSVVLFQGHVAETSLSKDTHSV